MITDGFMSNRISEMESRTINGIPAECQIWDIDRIYRVCSSDLGRQAIGIDFKAYTNGKGIPCLEASNANNEDYRSYLCIIPGSVLADIYDTYDSQLLEGNVRSFLSTKVAVNISRSCCGRSLSRNTFCTCLLPRNIAMSTSGVFQIFGLRTKRYMIALCFITRTDISRACIQISSSDFKAKSRYRSNLRIFSRNGVSRSTMSSCVTKWRSFYRTPCARIMVSKTL